VVKRQEFLPASVGIPKISAASFITLHSLNVTGLDQYGKRALVLDALVGPDLSLALNRELFLVLDLKRDRGAQRSNKTAPRPGPGAPLQERQPR
jgi:hypothetical protein